MYTLTKIIIASSCIFGLAGGAAAQSAFSSNPTTNNQMVTTQSFINESKAMKTALLDAGIKEKDITSMDIYKDMLDKEQIFEVKFTAGGKQYSYAIDAYTGTIVTKDLEIDKNIETGNISIEQAKSIAVKNVGLNVRNVAFTSIKEETEDGVQKIKVVFVHSNLKYEYEIDANSGAILKGGFVNTNA